MGKMAPLIVSLLAADAKSAVKRTRTLSIFYAIAALFAFTGFVAFVVSAGIFLAQSLKPEVAALVIAAVSISISLIVLASASIWSARQRRMTSSGSAAKTIAAAAAVSFLPLLASNRAGLGLAAAFAGYVFAKRNPTRRNSTTQSS